MARKFTRQRGGVGAKRKAANLEQLTRDESFQTRKVETLDSQVDLFVISYRSRLADPGGVSEKAAVDGCVNCGLLQDDGPKNIREVRHRQIKVKNREEEKTILVFIPVDNLDT